MVLVKEKQKNEYAQLDECLGLEEAIDGSLFSDGLPKKIYPVPLKLFSKFMDNLGIINSEALWTNFMAEDTEKAVSEVLSLSFRGNTADEISMFVNPVNFPKIIKKIMSVNGIEINKSGESGGVDGEKKE